MLCLAHEDLETDELVRVVCVRCKLLMVVVVIRMRQVLLLSVSGKMRGRRRRCRRGRVGRGTGGLGVCDEKIEECVCDIFGRTIKDRNTFREEDEETLPSRSSAAVLYVLSQSRCLLSIVANLALLVSPSLAVDGGCSKESKRLAM
jgi:hypothetical protein